MKNYILDDNNNPVLSDTPNAWEWRRQNPVKIHTCISRFSSGTFVSTVFLTLDHSWSDGPPVLWETIVFGGKHDGYQDRYTSYEDALKGHQAALKLVVLDEQVQPEVVTIEEALTLKGRKFKTVQ